MGFSLKPLSEQTIVITGASSGIGLATALDAASQGAKVVLAARNESALAENVARIEAEGGRAAFVVADVSQRSDVEKIAQFAIERFGGFDTWVNDAGVGLWGRLEAVCDADHRRLFDVNFWGMVYGSLVALDHLKQRGGALINVGSVASDMAFPVQGMYSASKHALKGFTYALRRELEAEKAPVSVTLIKPAAIDTPFVNNAKNYTAQEPVLPPPVYTPEDVAKVILFAATHPRRELHVGGAGKIMSALGKLVPGFVDKAASPMISSQLRKEPARPRQDNLYQAGTHGGELHGEDPARMVRPSLYSRAMVHPAAASAIVAAAGIAVSLLTRRMRG